MSSIRIAVAILVVLTSVTAVAIAGAPTPSKPWLAGYGSWSTYSMSDINDLVGAVNAELVGTGLSMDEINNGFGFGFEAGLDFQPVSVGVGYERLAASSDVGALGASLELKVPANAFYGLLEYRLPTAGPVGARLGIGGGVVSVSGEIRETVPGFGSESVDIGGTGPLLKFYGSADWRVSSQVSFFGSLGYRYAKVDKPEFAGESTSEIAIDHSGVMIRAGLRVALVP
jgi:hypothetical protein